MESDTCSSNSNSNGNNAIDSLDFIVLGTGLLQSVLAAALTRAGKRVCHVDRNDFYGESCAVFSLRSFMRQILAKVDSKDISSMTCHVHEDESKDEITTMNEMKAEDKLLIANMYRVSSPEYSKATPSPSNETLRQDFQETQIQKLLQKDRQFALDLSPKLLFSSGGMVNLLIKSNVGRYLDFKAVELVSIWDDDCGGGLQKVPGSKEDVFKDTRISLIDKRRLMKFLTNSLTAADSLVADAATTTTDNSAADIIGATKDESFMEYLNKIGLAENLKQVIINAMCLFPNKDAQTAATVKEGVGATRRYLESVGKFGKTPFLSGMYGTASELCQAFCRLSAVYGGLYILDFDPTIEQIGDEFHVSKGEIQLCAPKIICSPSYMKNLQGSSVAIPNSTKTRISRAVLILSGPLPGLGQLSFVVFPPETTGNCIYLLQMGSENGVCPEGYFLAYLFTDSVSESSESDLSATVRKLLGPNQSDSADTAPQCIFSIYYQHDIKISGFQDSNIILTPQTEGATSIHLETTVDEAKRLFETLCPDHEFFPAPPPEMQF